MEEKYHRRSIRLHGFDYSQAGYYFVTVCTQNQAHIFGRINNKEMICNTFGKIIDSKIDELKKYNNVDVDTYCIMPKHVHLIIHIVGAGPRACPEHKHVFPNTYVLGATQGSPPTKSNPTIGEYIKRFKTLSTKIYIENIKDNNWPRFDKRIWQRNYYERIIRDEEEYNTIRQYIQNNPLNWDGDEENV